ncbi:MAG: hypothetical protein JW956_11785 [Calditrichaceae bacterium]|nr:hypothetical protein [Calditrichaceae bacterium]
MSKNLIKSFLIFTLFCISCSDPSYTYDIDDLKGISQTNSSGEFVGELDYSDWSSCSYNGIYQGDNFLILNYKDSLQFCSDTSSLDTVKFVRFKNISSNLITIITEIDTPFSCKPDTLFLLPQMVQSITITFSTQFDTTKSVIDTLTMRTSNNERIDVECVGLIEGSEIAQVAVPEEVVFYPAYPNPASDNCTLKFSIPQQTWVELKIIDENGHVKRTLATGTYQPGIYKIDWDLRTSTYIRFASDLYRAFLKAGDVEIYGDIQIE